MSIDINIYAEVRGVGRWELAEPLERNVLRFEPFLDEAVEWKPRELYSVRNYAVFAILANVRNPTRAVASFDYISEPRGLPEDVSFQLLDWYTLWASESFSESWLLLEELVAFDWYGKQIIRRGMVDPAAAHLFTPDRRGFPSAEWPKGLEISVSEWRKDGVEVRWIETYAEAVGDEFLTETLGTLRSYGRAEDVRVVFWFSQ